MRTAVRNVLLVVLLMGSVIWISVAASSPQAIEKTDGTKFGKYVLTDSLYVKIPYYTGTSLVAREGKLQGNVSMCYHTLSKPISMGKPHSHDFEETLCFIGGNPLDITDFSAVVEYMIGDEKHVLTKTGCVTMPPGQVHAPINVTNVSIEKPIIFMEVSQTRSYTSTPKK